MTESKPAGGRLKGAKSPSYVRAVSTPEARASAFTARSMLVSDVAYVLSAAELGYTPAVSAHKLLAALLGEPEGGTEVHRALRMRREGR